MITIRTKWVLGGVAALLVSGALYAVPALAQERIPFMAGNTNMAALHQQMMGNTDMAAMHSVMAPLMEQMPAMHEQTMGEVATLFGMTLEELQTAMAEGRTLADLADEQKVAPGQVLSVMTRSMKGFLDNAVSEGSITREQANQLFQYHQQHGTDCLTGQAGMMGHSW